MITRAEFLQADQRAQELESTPGLEVATLAGGCFWCLEAPFLNTEGVKDVIAGYAGGDVKAPTYEEILTDTTRHREAVQVFFDPKKLSYQQILDIFWLQIDASDSGGQFADRGLQYTTAIFYHDETQRNMAETSKQQMNHSGMYDGPIATEVIPFTNFFPAEDYHQHYYLTNPGHYQRYSTLSGRKAFIDDLKKKSGKINRLIAEDGERL